MKIKYKFFLTMGILFLTCFSTLLAQDFRNPPDLQISIQPGLSYRIGSIGEYLFEMTGYGKPVSYAPNGGKQKSFLQWDINVLLEASLEVGFQYKSFVAFLNGRIGIPMQTGKMEDYDWISTKGHQTHFSSHKNNISSHYLLGGSLGWELSSEDKHIKILPMVGFTWQKTSMMAVDGYTQYVPSNLQPTTPWTPDIEKTYLSGNVISYAHEVYQIDCILRVTYNHNSKFYVNLDGSVHPIITAYGFDSHIKTGTDYLDYDMKGQLGLGAAITLGYQVIPKHFLTFKVDCNYLPIVIGQTYSKNISDSQFNPNHNNKGGTSHWFVGVTLGWKFNIFQ